MVSAGARDVERNVPPFFGAAFTGLHQASRGFTVSRVYPSLREAIHATATTSGMPMKDLAPLLDWAPSELSMRTTLGGDSARLFPLDDEHAVRIQEVTGDHSIVYTMLDKLGYEPPRLKVRDVPKMVAEARASVTEAVKKFQQLVLELDGQKGRAR